MPITKESLLSFFREKISAPVSYNELATRLSLDPAGKRGMKKILRQLLGEGHIIRTRKALYGLSAEMSLVTGYFEAHRDGYGFVIPDTPGERDIFIPSRSTSGAMANDRVIARMENSHRREGRIIRVLERASARISGTLERGRAAYFVRSKSRKITFDLYIQPDHIGRAREGDNVIAEIIRYPDEKRPAAGKIIKILEKPKTLIDDIEMIIDELGLPRRFPHAVLEEARKLPVLLESETGVTDRRKDLRSMTTVTIDGERARDFDDAVSITRNSSGFSLWVHIADVSHYVGWDSLIDKEARKRGTSVYFADRVIPMLPKELSEDICSLKPRVDRLAFTVAMEFDGDGRKISAKFYKSIINSNERMTYTAVKKVLVDGDVEEKKRYSGQLVELELMGELCNLIKKQRMKRGSLDFDLPEPEVLLDLQGNPEDIIRAERNFAHMIIEEFMIAANESVAEYLEGLDTPNIYRIHEEPDPMKLEEIVSTLGRLGLANIRKGFRFGDFGALLNRVKGTDEEDLVSHMVLRSLKQAKYSTMNVGHFGLASESYSHFTSPIRRYPDLVTHRILKEVLSKKHLGDKRAGELGAILPDIAFHSSRTERIADDAERAVLNAIRVWFMKDRTDELFPGKVVAVTSFGLKVRLRDIYVEGFLHVSYMTDDYYEYNEKNMSLIGLNRKKRFTIGMELTVRIESVNLEDREIVLGI
jgi:ribonuclease R